MPATLARTVEFHHRKLLRAPALQFNQMVAIVEIPVERPTGFLDQLGTEIVDIYVGSSKHQIRVHKALLASKVPYFKAMFEGGFMEFEQNSCTLPEEDPIIFGLFIEYLYGGGRLGPIDIEKSTTTNGPVVDRIKLYGYAEKICFVEMADYIMTNLVSTFHHYLRTPSKEGIRLAYSVTKPGSPIRKYMSQSLWYIMKYVDESSWSPDVVCEILRGVDDLLLDVVVAGRGRKSNNYFMGEKRNTDPRLYSKCEWHAHPRGAACALQGEIL
ncbi:hypothetical protein BJ875DRAFT_113722 [Amylocarpus encephaloides]|uniref:BTB domain-containing protein n=1 Tax=Amylocarpus encephaloides TaxID=45428 RepID=A0A9P7YQ04_9HELO|nr:hypothetical protein BJ875DRAFT_113722 [Amylocarpus encephaloides]